MTDLINRQEAIDLINATRLICPNEPRWSDNELINFLKSRPSAQPDIIYCKDCKHRVEKPIADGRHWCSIHMSYMYYCSDAERRTDEGD